MFIYGCNGTKSEVSSASIENFSLKVKQYSFKNSLAPLKVLIFRLANSTGSRLCSVSYKRSIRPFACGVWANIISIPSLCIEHPNCVRFTVFPLISSSTVSWSVLGEWKMVWRSE